MNITVVGLGYVGMANAVLLSQHNTVIAYDIDLDRVAMVNDRKSPIVDAELEEYLKHNSLDLTATNDMNRAFSTADYIIIATPTDYDPDTNQFNTMTVESVLTDIVQINNKATIVIKSTIPVGFTNMIKEKMNLRSVFFSPEFLREGRALYDNLYPSRIIVGAKTEEAEEFAQLIGDGACISDIPTYLIGSSEAEAIKLFSNTFLAMRIAFFNELDSYAEVHGLDTKEIIEGVGQDPRIGNYYNNPSFGYGGYCLPKDTRQLLANYKDVPNALITAIVEANSTRLEHITGAILKKKPCSVGVYRLVMKANSDNFRSSSIQEIIKKLVNQGVAVSVYEPVLQNHEFMNLKVYKDLEEFKENCDLIIANRIDDNLNDVLHKVYTRDVYGIN